MANLNQVFIVGNLTRDPEIRFVPSGSAVAKMGVATNRRYKAGNGEWKDEVTFLTAEVWGKSAEWCGERLRKGSPVLIQGRLKNNEWTAQDGQKRSQLEVAVERIQGLEGRQAAEPEIPMDGQLPAADGGGNGHA